MVICEKEGSLMTLVKTWISSWENCCKQGKNLSAFITISVHAKELSNELSPVNYIVESSSITCSSRFTPASFSSSLEKLLPVTKICALNFAWADLSSSLWSICASFHQKLFINSKDFTVSFLNMLHLYQIRESHQYSKLFDTMSSSGTICMTWANAFESHATWSIKEMP